MAAGILTFSPLMSQQPAEAAVCGYSVETQEYGSIIHINSPLGPIAPFGGERRVAHYGHCGEGNVKIEVTADNRETETKCVTPGDSVLGFTESGPKIKFAKAVGAC